MRSPCLILVASGLALSACSQSSGIPQVDKARDTLARELGLGSELRPVSDAADKAVRSAETAGRHGDAKSMAAAVTKGTGEVLCAGVAMKKPIAEQVGRNFEARVPEIEGKREAITVYKGATGIIPAIPSPC